MRSAVWDDGGAPPTTVTLRKRSEVAGSMGFGLRRAGAVDSATARRMTRWGAALGRNDGGMVSRLNQ